MSSLPYGENSFTVFTSVKTKYSAYN